MSKTVRKPAARRAATMAGRTGRGQKPLPFAQIAFAGHNRPSDLGDAAQVSAGLKAAFSILAAAGLADGRLVAGVASGADLLAVEAWKAAGLGPVHAVLPYLDDAAYDPTGLADSATRLNGKATEALGRNAHLAQTRWLIGTADLLVVVWTGAHARGAGGTADAVRLALEQSIPILWIKPGEPGVLRLIRSEHLDEDFGFLEVLEDLQLGRAPLVRKATPAALREAFADQGLAGETAASEPEAATPRPVLFVRWWRAYAVFRRTLGGTAPSSEAYPTPPDLLAEPGFRRLSQAYERADRAANHLGAEHRSHQVILLLVAIVASFVGSASALWPPMKLAMAAFELLLALGAFVVWRDLERGRRHQRWGDARQHAEDLRLERVAWALGVSTVARGANFGGGSTARRERRLAGLPTGMFDRRRVKSWGDWAINELLIGQAAYHRAQSRISSRVSHRVHQGENASFAVFLVVLLSYVVSAVAALVLSRERLEWLDGLVTVAGTIAPAIGAAGLALEATFSLAEQAQRSRVLATHLEAVAANLGSRPSLEALQAAAKAAIRLQRAQEDYWSEGTARRRLIRGG